MHDRPVAISIAITDFRISWSYVFLPFQFHVLPRSKKNKKIYPLTAIHEFRAKHFFFILTDIGHDSW